MIRNTLFVLFVISSVAQVVTAGFQLKCTRHIHQTIAFILIKKHFCYCHLLYENVCLIHFSYILLSSSLIYYYLSLTWSQLILPTSLIPQYSSTTAKLLHVDQGVFNNLLVFQNGGIHNKSPISNVPGKTKKSFSQPRWLQSFQLISIISEE